MDKGKSTPSKRGAVFGKGGIGTVSSFLGRRPPQEIKNLVELLPRVPDTLFKRVLKFVVEHIKGTEIPSEQWQKLVQTTTEVDETGLCTLFAGLLMILKTAVRDGVEESFQSDLTELQVSAPYITLLAQARKGLKAFVLEGADVISYPKLDSMDYRVDVTITTSEMDRVLKPTVLMKIVDDKGDIRTFEMNPEQFHKLRFSVARVLKEFDSIEKTSILKIDKVTA